MGDRDFRFEKIREKLNEPVEPESFGFHENVPEYYSRMKAVEKTLKKEGIEETSFNGYKICFNSWNVL